MDRFKFSQTTIGNDYWKTGQTYPVDDLLEYLFGLMAMRKEGDTDKLTNEIEAVKEILTIQTRL